MLCNFLTKVLDAVSRTFPCLEMISLPASLTPFSKKKPRGKLTSRRPIFPAHALSPDVLLLVTVRLVPVAVVVNHLPDRPADHLLNQTALDNQDRQLNLSPVIVLEAHPEVLLRAEAVPL